MSDEAEDANKRRSLKRHLLAFGRRGSVLMTISLLLSLGAATGKVALEQHTPVPVAAAAATTTTGLSASQNAQPTLTSPTDAAKVGQATPNTPATPQSAVPTPSSARSVYRAPVCTYRSVPYKTVYQNASWLDVGKTQEFSGMDGQEKICNPSDGGAPTVTTVYAPYDKKVYIGTYVKPSYSTTPTYTPAPAAPKNYSICSQFSGSSAYEQCLYAVSQQ
jgi:hypothetical protein